MLVYAGIDEAGYGPMLGPLCVASATFVLKDADPTEGPPDLWDLLASAVCRRSSDKKRRIAIDDSKKLKGASSARAHPCRHLERGVLAGLYSSTNALPESDTALLDLIKAPVPTEPWYEGDPICLPLAGTSDEHRITGAMLQRALESAGIALQEMACETIHPRQINTAASARERKSSLNLAAALRLADRIRCTHRAAHPRIIIDRQGGRSDYREQLAMAWPHASIRILGETKRVSRYRLDFPEGPLTISFEAESEQAHLPAALASMTAKLVRELHMARLNRFFGARIPDLKPTAGYVQDGRRFVQEVDPLLRKLKLDEHQLIRSV